MTWTTARCIRCRGKFTYTHADKMRGFGRFCSQTCRDGYVGPKPWLIDYRKLSYEVALNLREFDRMCQMEDRDARPS